MLSRMVAAGLGYDAARLIRRSEYYHVHSPDSTAGGLCGTYNETPSHRNTAQYTCVYEKLLYSDENCKESSNTLALTLRGSPGAVSDKLLFHRAAARGRLRRCAVSGLDEVAAELSLIKAPHCAPRLASR
ncbi:hypothetical protein EVAR_49553_1 [Eumeta japonica]|uniref:Uncharacterized protein n=1 Tax=Eumeta variegata TaxID=151549 RepID=A0A4C1XMJ2_EUMVA|nr:hypothetical protein EVAR_49553_1 [Eumeta japonica]